MYVLSLIQQYICSISGH